MIELTMADFERVAREYGHAAAQLWAYQRLCADRDAEIFDLRAQLAAALAQIGKPDGPEGGVS